MTENLTNLIITQEIPTTCEANPPSVLVFVPKVLIII